MIEIIDVALGILTEQRPVDRPQALSPQAISRSLEDSAPIAAGVAQLSSINKEKQGAVTASSLNKEDQVEMVDASDQSNAHSLETELRILIAKRPSHTVYGGYWELPGGKIDPNETPEAALVREFEEELGIIVAHGDPLDRVIHTYPHAKVQLIPFFCTRVSGQIQNLAVTEHKWVLPRELNSYQFPEANLPIIKQLQQILQNSDSNTASVTQ